MAYPTWSRLETRASSFGKDSREEAGRPRASSPSDPQRQLVLHDIDGNGATDVVAFARDSFGGGLVSIFYQDPDGHLASAGCRRQGTDAGRVAIGDVTSNGSAGLVIAGGTLSRQLLLGPGQVVEAEIEAWEVDNGPVSAGGPIWLGGLVTVSDRYCKPSRNVEIWGSPAGMPAEKLATFTASEHPLSAEMKFAGSVTADRAGIWTVVARWDGFPVYGELQSESVHVDVSKAPTSINLDVEPRLIDYGRGATLDAQVGADELPIPEGAVVEFFADVAGTRRKVGEGVTDAEGRVSLDVRPKFTTRYEARYAGDADHDPSSDSVRIEVRADARGKMTRYKRRSHGYAIYRREGRVFFSTTVDPDKTGEKVQIYLQVRRNGGWRFAGSAEVRLGRRSRVVIYIAGASLSRRRPYRLSSEILTDRFNVGDQSEWAFFRVV